jgi:hypothetical protein
MYTGPKFAQNRGLCSLNPPVLSIMVSTFPNGEQSARKGPMYTAVHRTGALALGGDVHTSTPGPNLLKIAGCVVSIRPY